MGSHFDVLEQNLGHFIILVMLSIICLCFCFVEFCSTCCTKSCYLVLISINARLCSIFGAGKSRTNTTVEIENVGKYITFDD